MTCTSTHRFGCAVVFGLQKHGCHPTPTYSPDLDHCDFVLLLKMKIMLKGQRFDTMEEMQAK